MTRSVKSVITSGNTSQFNFVIQNCCSTTIIVNTHRQTTVLKTRGTVTIALYRRCKVTARSRSIETALKVNNDAPDVVQLDMVWIICKEQYALESFPSSAILSPTKDGWQISPTRRSEAAKQNRRTNDGEWSSSVFRITCRIIEFPMHVAIENTEFRKHGIILSVNVTLVWSKWMSKRLHVRLPVAFIVSLLPAVLWN